MRARFAAFPWVLCASLIALAARADDVQQEVQKLLESGVESSVPPETYRALGRDGLMALIDTFERTDAPRHVRLRALSALSAFRMPESEAYLRKLVRSTRVEDGTLGELHPARSSLVLKRALQGLISVSSRPVADDFVAALGHRDPEVRKTAALGLSRVDSAAARKALEAQLRVEASPRVREALERALTSRPARSPSRREDAPKSGSPPR